MYPKLKFIISKNKDLETFIDFLEQSKIMDMKRDIDWAFFSIHHKLKIINDKNLICMKKKAAFKEYIDEYYNKNIDKVKDNTKIIKQDWKSTESKFFELTDKIFKGRLWPKGKYIAYPTIWGMYPRFLEEKTFQFPYSHKEKKYAIFVIAHEMLHFIFYDYFYSCYPEYQNNEFNFFVWNISEIFNSIIQNSQDWQNAIQGKTLDYPEHEKIIEFLSRKYCQNSNFNARDLIQDILKAYKHKKR